MKPFQMWRRCARWAGLTLDDGALNQLERYREWLIDEAIPAGGLGPDEAPRIDQRHIGDSLLFGVGIDDDGDDEIWDMGSGVGLPGIPLAIALPERRLILVDRSGRRIDLVRRVARILRLENVEAITGEIESVDREVTTIVSRATLKPSRAGKAFAGVLRSGGRAIIGGSWDTEPIHDGWETVPVPRWVLDREVWLLMMRQP